MDEIAARLEAVGQNPPKVRPNDPPYAEQRCTDPDGNMIDISMHGYEKVEHQANRQQRAGEKA